MKKTSIFLILMVTALILTACNGESTNAQVNQNNTVQQQVQNNIQEEQTVEQQNQNENSAQEENGQPVEPQMQGTPMPLDFATFFPVDYENALSARNQLAIGTLRLQNTSYPISTEQSQSLLPLWQALLALESNPGSAPQELSAVQNQILTTLTSDQLNEIVNMQLTNDDLVEIYNELGLTLQVNSDGTTTMGSGQGGGMGAGGGQDPAAREATRTAAEALGTPVGTGGGQGQSNKNQLTIAVIDFLTDLVNN